MGIEHLNEKDIKSIKGVNSFLKLFKIAVLILLGLVIFVTMLPIVTPLYLKRPDRLLESIKLMLTTDYYYIMVGGFVMSLAFYKSISKLMAIINKLMKSDKET